MKNTVADLMNEPYLVTLPQDIEYIQIVADLLESPWVKLMNGFIQHGELSCLSHSIEVSYAAYCYCKKHSLDAKAAARGGLLHDMFLYDWHKDGSCIHGFTHSRIALTNAKKHFNLTRKEENIILRHMWPLTVIPPKYREGFVVSRYDKTLAFQEWITKNKLFIAVKGVF